MFWIKFYFAMKCIPLIIIVGFAAFFLVLWIAIQVEALVKKCKRRTKG